MRDYLGPKTIRGAVSAPKTTIGGALAQSNINPIGDLVLSKRIKSLRVLWSRAYLVVFSACAAEPASGNFKMAASMRDYLQHKSIRGAVSTPKNKSTDPNLNLSSVEILKPLRIKIQCFLLPLGPST